MTGQHGQDGKDKKGRKNSNDKITKTRLQGYGIMGKTVGRR